jgi:putative redox protein
MKINTVWNEKMVFTSSADSHEVKMDTKSPIGTDTAMTPKQLVLAGLAGCTAMDVVALMRKHKQTMDSFQLEIEAEKSKGGYPEVFNSAVLTFKLKGTIDPEKAKEAVVSSQTKYCGVSAMLSKAFPIHYVIELNDQKIFEGETKFA